MSFDGIVYRYRVIYCVVGVAFLTIGEEKLLRALPKRFPLRIHRGECIEIFQISHRVGGHCSRS